MSDASGDGLSDVLIGSPGNNHRDTNAGKVHYIPSEELVSGESSLSEVTRSILGENAYDFAGESLKSLGDYDGDGKGDFLLGVPHGNGVGADSGNVYFISGAWL